MRGSVRKRGDKWYYSFEIGRVEGKRKRIERVGGNSQKEAEQALRKALTEYESNGYFFEPSEISVADYLHYWYKEYVQLNLRPNTQDNYERVIRLQLNPKVGNLKLKMLTPPILQQVINDLHREGYAYKSLTIFHSVLSNALGQAVHPWNLIKSNPMLYVRLPKKERSKKTKKDLKILTSEELKKITDYLHEEHAFYIPFYIGLFTGMRVSEVCGLKWCDIDFEEKTVTVDRAMKKDKNGEWSLGSTKTEASERTIPLGETILNILKKHRTRVKKNKLKYGEFYIDSDHICVKENGKIITPSVIKYNTRKIKEKLNINLNFHSLRHTHATILMENGAKIKDIQERLGHSRSAITIDTYSHLTKKMQKESVNILESVFSEIE